MYLKSLPISQKIYIFISSTISGILSYHVELEDSLTIFSIVVILDSITRIHANAKKKGLKFNPFALYFWKEIKSNDWSKKGEYDGWDLENTIVSDILAKDKYVSDNNVFQSTINKN